MIHQFPVTLGKVTVPVTVTVFDNSKYPLILGNEFFHQVQAKIHYSEPYPMLELAWLGRRQQIPTEYIKEVEDEEEDITPEEYERIFVTEKSDKWKKNRTRQPQRPRRKTLVDTYVDMGMYSQWLNEPADRTDNQVCGQYCPW